MTGGARLLSSFLERIPVTKTIKFMSGYFIVLGRLGTQLASLLLIILPPLRHAARREIVENHSSPRSKDAANRNHRKGLRARKEGERQTAKLGGSDTLLVSTMASSAPR